MDTQEEIIDYIEKFMPFDDRNTNTYDLAVKFFEEYEPETISEAKEIIDITYEAKQWVIKNTVYF